MELIICKSGKKAPPSQPGLEPGSSAYAADALPLKATGTGERPDQFSNTISPLRLCFTT